MKRKKLIHSNTASKKSSFIDSSEKIIFDINMLNTYAANGIAIIMKMIENCQIMKANLKFKI